MAREPPNGPHAAMKRVWLIRAVLFTPVVVAFVVPGWLVGLFIAVEASGSWVWFWFGLLVPAALWLVWNLVDWSFYHERMTFRFDDEAVIVKRGVFFRRTTHIPLRRVQDVVVKEGPLLSAFGLYTLHLQTAAQGQTNIAEGQLPGIRDGHGVAEHLMDRIRALRGDV